MNQALDFLRGAVRPVVLIGSVGTTLGLAAFGDMERAKFAGEFAGPFVAWWFASRKSG